MHDANFPSLDAHWMPFTANRQFKAEPRRLVAAQGMYYRSDDDRVVLDGTAGLWCVNAGHGRRRIADAVRDQLLTLDFAPGFQMGHPLSRRSGKRSAVSSDVNAVVYYDLRGVRGHTF